MTAINLDPAPPVDGCTAPDCGPQGTPCGSQDTVTLDSRHGRRCATHAPRFDADVAVAVALTDPGAAADYARAVFPEEAS